MPKYEAKCNVVNDFGDTYGGKRFFVFESRKTMAGWWGSRKKEIVTWSRLRFQCCRLWMVWKGCFLVGEILI